MQHWLGSEAALVDHVHLVRYEELRRDPETQLADVLSFLGATVDGSAITAAVANNTLERMQEKEAAASDRAFAARVQREIRFVKDGPTDWRGLLSSEQRRAIEERFGPAMRDLGYETEDG